MTTTGPDRDPSDDGEGPEEGASTRSAGVDGADGEGEGALADRPDAKDSVEDHDDIGAGGFSPSERYEAGRPSRPPVLPARVAPKLRPPDPPDALVWSATAWRVTSLALGLAVGLVFLDVMTRKRVVREMLEERAPDLGTDMIDRATNILFFGSLATWGVLAILALLVARGMKRPVLRPRFMGSLLLMAILGVLAFTAFPLTSAGGLGLAARASLGVAAGAAVAATVLGLAPGTWSWVREHRGRSGRRRPTAARPAPPPPPPDR